MKYYQIYWIHDYPTDPIYLYSEVGNDGYEIRKINIYRDNTVGYAIDEIEFNGAGLSEKPFPPLEELNGKDEWDELISQEISFKEFEQVWEEKVVPLLKL